MESSRKRGERRLIERKALSSRGINRGPVTLWRWEKAGRLTPIRIANRVFYDEAEVDALIERGDEGRDA